jgi:rhamnosyl/mannosyltransferase
MAAESVRQTSSTEPGPISVLHVYKDYFPVLGGIENHVRLLAQEQVRRGLDVTVLVTADGLRTVEKNDQGVRVIKAGRLTTVASTPISLSLFAQLRRLRPDVTHLHFPYPVGELAQLLCGRSRSTVVTYHSDVVRQKALLKVYRPIMQRVLDRADRLIATNAAYVASSPFLRDRSSRTSVVPLGISTEALARVSPEEVASLRARFAAGRSGPGSPPTRGSRPLLVSVGRLRYYKGLDVAIRAMRGVDATLLIVGSGPMAAEWTNLVRRLGLSDRVVFAGEVPDAELPAYFHAADIYVSSASHRSEAFGISLLEAMACGKPLVSTELGTGTSFVNRHGETGLVVPANDPERLADAILRLLASPGERERMGRAGRARVEAEFTLAIMADRIDAIYEDVLSRSGGPSG